MAATTLVCPDCGATVMIPAGTEGAYCTEPTCGSSPWVPQPPKDSIEEPLQP